MTIGLGLLAGRQHYILDGLWLEYSTRNCVAWNYISNCVLEANKRHRIEIRGKQYSTSERLEGLDEPYISSAWSLPETQKSCNKRARGGADF